jgi:hypothetical protein
VITVSIAKARQIKTGIKFLCWIAFDFNVSREVGIFSLSFIQSRDLKSPGRSLEMSYNSREVALLGAYGSCNLNNLRVTPGHLRQEEAPLQIMKILQK